MKKIQIKKEFREDYISREAGERLRQMILQATKDKGKVEIDFGGLLVASTSFFDEGFAKLALEGWTQENFDSYIQLKGLSPKDHEILKKLCFDRGMK